MIEFNDVARAAQAAQARGEKHALATIVHLRGSSPRHNGARMLVSPDSGIIGTIGGGTLEYRVIEDALAALADGSPRIENYVFDASGRPGSVGLCGGSVDVHISVDLDRFTELSEAAREALGRGEAVVLATLLGREGEPPPQQENSLLIWPDGRTRGTLGSEKLAGRVIEAALETFPQHRSRLVQLEPGGNADSDPWQVHLDLLEPREMLLIVGAGHVAQPLAAIGSMVGFRVCVVDDRPEWANTGRFPSAAQIAVIGYQPEGEILDPIPIPMSPNTYVVITTWGYDLPAMEQALQQNPAYIGLVASPTKARVLFKRLRQAGYADEHIQRIQAPVGLDLGAESPAELALSVLAEILMTKHGKTGRPLREIRGEIIDMLFAAPLKPKT